MLVWKHIGMLGVSFSFVLMFSFGVMFSFLIHGVEEEDHLVL